MSCSIPTVFVRICVCSFLDFDQLCLVELLSSEWRSTIFSAGNGALWRLLTQKYFPQLEDAEGADEEPAGELDQYCRWKETFRKNYTWQTCRVCEERFERHNNSPHACMGGGTGLPRRESWHVSTQCPDHLNPNGSSHPRDFVLDQMRTANRREFLFHFPPCTSPSVSGYLTMLQRLQKAFETIVWEVVETTKWPQGTGTGQAPSPGMTISRLERNLNNDLTNLTDLGTFGSEARRQFPKLGDNASGIADLVIEMFVANTFSADELLQKMPLPRLKRLLVSSSST